MAGGCASTSSSAPSGIPTLCGVWPSARRMCCSSRRTSSVVKPCYVNVIEKVRQVVRGSRPARIAFFAARREGNWPEFSFYVVEANLAWIHSQPPRRCACVQLRSKGPWLATVLHRDSGFHIKSSASSRGRTTRRFFAVLSKSAPDQPTELFPGTNLRHPAYHLAGRVYPAPGIREERAHAQSGQSRLSSGDTHAWSRRRPGNIWS